MRWRENNLLKTIQYGITYPHLKCAKRIMYFMDACICSNSIKIYLGIISKFRIGVNSGEKGRKIYIENFN